MADASSLALALGGFTRRQNPYDLRRQEGQKLLQMGADTSPILSPWQGVARLAQALTGGVDVALANRDEKAQNQATIDSLSKLAAAPDQASFNAALGGLKTTNNSDVVAPILAQVVGQRQQQLQNQAYAGDVRQAYGAPPAIGGTFSVAPAGAANAIAGTESGGQPNNGYGAIGPPADAKGSRAVGRYQVMDYNVGPWTKEVLGQELTPQQFLANPQAQDAVFEKKFGQLVTQTGSPQAASRAWFAGLGGMNNPNATDVNGMTPQRYEQKFVENGGAQPATAPQTPQLPEPIAPPAPTVVPRPAPDPQVVSDVSDRVGRGLISRADGIKEIEASRDKQQQLLQAQADKTYAQQLGDYTANRGVRLQGTEHDRQQATAPMNAEQSLSAGFADRMARSNGIVAQIPAATETSSKGKALDYIPFGVGNLMQDPAYQQYKQARDDFINAQLRRESGAAIAPSEYANADRQYFPQPGDSKEVLAQKELNRKLAIEGMVRNAGPTYQASPTVSAPAIIATTKKETPPPQPGTIMDGYRFKGGDPSKKENWEAAQ